MKNIYKTEEYVYAKKGVQELYGNHMVLPD